MGCACGGKSRATARFTVMDKSGKVYRRDLSETAAQILARRIGGSTQQQR